ncbi:MAG TPA: LPS export ABC transporter permease LptF [Desulfobulbus sp.]|nr:LPS export ABC transporter permease LptF [Desulfobulbus sp.]
MSRIHLPLLLYSYIATELLAPFFASFLILYGVFFLVRLVPLLDVVLSLGIGITDFIRLFSYIFPHMLLYVIPMASMTGVIIAFTRLTNDREILALKACGISLRQILVGVILVSLSIALLTGFFSIRLIPAGEVAMRQLMFQLAKEKIDKGLKEKQFTEALGDLVVYVDRIDEQKKWHGVYVSDMRNREQPIITMARKGHMKADINRMMVTIVLNNGTLHNIQGQDNQVIRFKRYQLQIPLKPPTRIDGDDVTRIGKGSMTQTQLLAAADAPGRTPRERIMYLAEYNHRLVLPVGCFILSLLGMPLGLQAGPGKKAIGIPMGLGFFVLYYLAFTVARVMVEDLTLPLVLGMWAPNILFLIITLYVFHRTEQEQTLLPKPLQEFLNNTFDRVIAPIFSGCRVLFHNIISRHRKKSDNENIQSTELVVHANGLSLVYHLPGCEHYDCENCTIKFKDIQVAEDAGFTPCRFCKKHISRQGGGQDQS